MPNSLAGSILRAKYHPRSGILEAQVGVRPSFLWRSLLVGRDLLKLGVRLRVGNGEKIFIYDDPWTELVRTSLIGFEADRILSTPLPPSRRFDQLQWHYHEKGVYTVRSGYKLAITLLNRAAEGGPSSGVSVNDRLWKLIWSSPIQPRIQIFLWKVIHDCLPTAKNLHRRRLGTSECVLCGAEVEDLRHCFVDCVIPKAIRSNSSTFGKLLRNRIGSLKELLLVAFEDAGVEGFSLVANILWQSWKARCSSVFEDAAISIKSLVSLAEQNNKDYITANRRISQPISPSLPLAWSKPPPGFIKVNVDASLKEASAGLGFIVRDDAGSWLYAACTPVPVANDVEFLELCALLEGLKLAFTLGYSHVMLEGDSLLAYHRLQDKDEDLSIHGAIVDDLFSLVSCFHVVKFSYVKKVGNVPAHILSRIGAIAASSTVWEHNLPTDVLHAIMADIT